MHQFGTFGMLFLLTRACVQGPVAEGGEPSEIDDYSEEELAELAESEDVKRNEEPFAKAPPFDEAVYVTMSDGVRLAVNLYYPDGFEQGRTRAPTVYVETWYGRGREADTAPVTLYRRAGYVVAVADPRGFGASFGSQSSYLTDEQRNDQREMLAWISRQPWSNGQVAPIGISVSAMLAESVLGSGAKSVQAGIVRATEWDQYSENLFPGGVPNSAMHGLIAYVLDDLMRGEPCLQDTANCFDYGPVDADKDALQLQTAMRDHQNNVSGAAIDGLQYADEKIGGYDFLSVGPIGHVEELAENAVPTRVAASWLDGMTAQGALTRFNTLKDVPMQLSLAATTHLAGLDADPFATEPFQPARIAPSDWFGQDIEFLDRALSKQPIERKVDYYVLGADTWKSTDVWPPRNVKDHVLHFSARGLEAHAADSGEREYKVDPESSSGLHGRWASQRNGLVYFGDRRALPGVRASFDAEPVEQDMELVGAPELCLALRSDQTDGAVFAYLEDVAPDGRVTYLTEGLLRLLHRKTKSGGCDPAPGTERSFKQADGAAVVPGELMQVEIPLLPLAARIAEGHHLRLSLAGADSGTFPMLTETPATWNIAYGGDTGSTLRVPLRRWK